MFQVFILYRYLMRRGSSCILNIKTRLTIPSEIPYPTQDRWETVETNGELTEAEDPGYFWGWNILEKITLLFTPSDGDNHVTPHNSKFCQVANYPFNTSIVYNIVPWSLRSVTGNNGFVISWNNGMLKGNWTPVPPCDILSCITQSRSWSILHTWLVSVICSYDRQADCLTV